VARVDEDEGRTLVQMALQDTAAIQPTENELRITLAPLSSSHRSRALEALCEGDSLLPDHVRSSEVSSLYRNCELNAFPTSRWEPGFVRGRITTRSSGSTALTYLYFARILSITPPDRIDFMAMLILETTSGETFLEIAM